MSQASFLGGILTGQFQARSQWGQFRKQADDKWVLGEKREPVSTVLKTFFCPGEKNPCAKMSKVKMSVHILLFLSFLCKFHEVTLIFTVCCVLLQSLMSAVFRINSRVEVALQV